MMAVSDLIVWASVVLAMAYAVAWAWSPHWRDRIERPKHDFQDALAAYDEGRDEHA